MPNFAQNIANMRVITPKQAEIDWQTLLLGVSYTHLRYTLGNAVEDLFHSMRDFSLEQKVGMAQAWEEYFCQTNF